MKGPICSRCGYNFTTTAEGRAVYECPQCTGNVSECHACDDTGATEANEPCENCDVLSEWTTEAPTEPGWYQCLSIENGEVCVLIFQGGKELLVRFPHMAIKPLLDVKTIKYWGPKIQFPPPPESEDK